MRSLVELAEPGFFCPPGGFYIDPWRATPRAVITHAHSDHARPGSDEYICTTECAPLLRERIGPAGRIRSLPYGESLDVRGVRVSLHPAGHILGSAQVRIEHRGEVTVISGDYKLAPDPTCAPFEHVRCDTFISEATFGLPIYRWRPQARMFDELNDWWRENQAAGRLSVVYAYALGKAQRVLAGVDAKIGPIAAHGAIRRFLPPYRAAGVALPEVLPAGVEVVDQLRGRGLLFSPPSAADSTWMRKFGPNSTAFASGWMQIRGARRRRSLDRGFPLSDHADWDGLLTAIRASGARRIGVTHGQTAALARYLRELGYEAQVYVTRFSDTEEDAEALEAAELSDREPGE